jgi:hypothetical protein
MTTEVKMSLQVTVDGGPSWKINATDDVEAYGVIDVTIAAGAADKEVEVQPATDAARVNVLVIQSDLYGAEITYKASDGTDDSDPVTLHGPHFFGRGVASLFGVDVLSLKFSNANAAATNKHARIQILVGRDATP